VHLPWRHRLDEVARDVLAERFGERAVLFALGDHDDLESRFDLPDLLDGLETAGTWHLLVEQDEVERPTPNHLERVVGVRGGFDFEPLVTQEDAMRLEQLRLVVDPEYGLGLNRHEAKLTIGGQDDRKTG
jgi:hypothetical protein